MNDEGIRFPDILLDDKLEMAYVGLLHNNPKAISTFYIESSECYFSVPGILEVYKLVLFREGQKYAPEAAKAHYNFPKPVDATYKQTDECKAFASKLTCTIEDVYLMVRKLFILRKNYVIAPTEGIQKKVVEMRLYKKYDEMTIEQMEARLNNLSFMTSLKETVINEGATQFLLEGNNNLKSGITTPFPIMTKVFKGLRKGETMSFAMPSNAGKSRFIVNLISHLVFIENQKVLLISNEMTEDKMKLCLITTIVNNPAIQKIHGQKLEKREAELLGLKFRPDAGKKVETDKDGFILRKEDESNEEFVGRLTENSTEFVKTLAATDWLSKQIDSCIFFIHTSDHSNDDLKNMIMDYYYKEGIEYFFYDTLKTDIEHIGNREELKKTATVLSNIAQKYKVFIGSTLQLAENTTRPLNLNITDIADSRTVKEVLDNLCLVKEINNTTYEEYEFSEEEESLDYKDLEKSYVPNTRYYACVVDKNRAGEKPRLLFRLNLDYNRWEEQGYVRYKQEGN